MRLIPNDGSHEALRSVVRRELARPLNRAPRRGVPPPDRMGWLLNAKSASPIPARSGNVVGEGEVTLHSIVDGELTEGEVEDCVNVFGSVIPADTWLQVARGEDGVLQVVSVDCGA